MQSVGTSHRGKVRSENQDTIFYSDVPVGQLDNLYIVADGMGGHKAGGFASSFAVRRFVELIREIENSDPIEIMKEALQKVSSEILLKCQEEEYAGMGTTMVAATVTEESIFVMNIGDSRLYFADQDLVQITTDHSFVEELVKAGELERGQMRQHPKRNLITRAIGAGIESVPDFFELPKKSGYLLLCSDGLTSMVADDEIKELLLDHSQLENKAGQLVNRANEYGGKDNISLVIVALGERGEITC